MGRIMNYVVGAVIGAAVSGGIVYNRMDARFDAFRNDPARLSGALEQAYDSKAALTDADRKLLNDTTQFAYGRLVKGIDPSAIKPGHENPANLRIRIFTTPEGTYAGLGSMRDMKVHAIRYENGQLACDEKSLAVNQTTEKQDVWNDIWNKMESGAKSVGDAIDNVVGD